MNFLEIQKECFQIRGELQNGSIVGVNDDEKDLMKKNINRIAKEISDMHPPFLQHLFHLHLSNSINLVSGVTATVTGTTDMPRLIDSASVLNKRDVHKLASDGTYRKRVISVTGTTYTLGSPLFTNTTTATTWKVYKDTYPLPHDLGHVHNMFWEDGDRRITLVHRAKYEELSRRMNVSTEPNVYCIDAFTNKWGKEKSSESSVTVANGSNKVIVADNTLYDVGDVCQLGVGTTHDVHTFTGSLGTTMMFLDRDYLGSRTAVTLRCNPNEYTHYVSFYNIPSTRKELLINGYIEPPEMVYDTDTIPQLPERLFPAVVIGALLRDQIGKGMLTEEFVNWYTYMMRLLRQKKDADVYKNAAAPSGFFNRHYQASDITW